jgi:hypothetical protein
LGCGEGVGGGNLDVGLDAGSFPVGLGDGVDGAGKGHANHKMVVNAATGTGWAPPPVISVTVTQFQQVPVSADGRFNRIAIPDACFSVRIAGQLLKATTSETDEQEHFWGGFAPEPTVLCARLMTSGDRRAKEAYVAPCRLPGVRVISNFAAEARPAN